MGRKIPGAKHHGVKDPAKQHERRMKTLSTKINAPPTDPDEQPIPKSLTRLFGYREPEKKVKRKSKSTLISAVSQNAKPRHENPVSSLSKLPGESGRSFNQRINNALHSINKGQLQAAEMQQTLDPDNYLPEENMKDARYSMIEEKKLKRKQKAAKVRKEQGDMNSTGTKLSRMQRWAIKKKEKQAEKLEEKDEEMYKPKYDKIKFGEVAHEPPSLHIKPRRAQSGQGAPRPGRRDLLLTRILEQNPAPTEPKQTTTTIDKKGKRKALPVGVRMRLEQSRKEAVLAYRSLKAQATK